MEFLVGFSALYLIAAVVVIAVVTVLGPVLSIAVGAVLYAVLIWAIHSALEGRHD